MFAKTDSRGVLVYALIATATIGAAYFWLINASALAEFITWAGIAWSHYKFRKPTSLKAKISMIYHLKQNGTYLSQF
ncbi:hypothetical protein [Campylobacter sp. P0109]|uniref:hypothetical protein n=1 Tax=Campylobacter sp. P0109 TaxID=1895606 RepID=UPI0030155BDA